MADYLLDLSRNSLAKSLVRRFKLPIPLPEPLVRPTGPWAEAPLSGKTFAIGAARGPRQQGIVQQLSRVIEAAGGKIPGPLTTSPAVVNGAVFDASDISTVQELEQLYDFVKPRLQALAPSGRLVLVGAGPGSSRSPGHAAAQGALRGFVKSLARELGRRGATVQLISLDHDTTTSLASLDMQRLALPLTFFLSDASAFISGQEVTISRTVQAPEGPDGNICDVSRPWSRPLAGKVAIVTGAAQGIGAKIALKLASEGARIVGIDRPQAQASLDRTMHEVGGTAWTVDLLAPEAVKTIVARAETELGAFDILVNNAGMTRDKTLGRMPRDYWEEALALNLGVPMALTEALTLGDATLFRLMNPGGRVLFLASISGIGGNAGQTNYAAAKAGLMAYADALAPRLAAKGITVNALAPGFIETEMTDKVPMGVRELARRMNALNQAGRPEDVAEAAAFLAAPGAYGITGSTLRVCGLNVLGA